MNSFCTQCGGTLPPDANFCPQCGKKIKEPGPSVTLMEQLRVYGISLIVPFSGFWYGYLYLRHGGVTEQKIGYIAMALTIISIAVTIWSIVAFMGQLNQSLQGTNLLYGG